MYTIIHLTDIHGASHFIDKIVDEIEQADLVVISGDITHFGNRREAEKIILPIVSYNQNVLAVPGNCDYPGVEDYLLETGINLHLILREIEGFILLGIGGSIPCPGPTPFEYSEENAQEWLDPISGMIIKNLPLIFVSHQPPYYTTADKLPDGSHVGSRSISRFIDTVEPLVCLTGHIHEGIGIDSHVKTTIINPGPFRAGRYAKVEIGNDGKVHAELKQITVSGY